MEGQLLPCQNFNTIEGARCDEVLAALKFERPNNHSISIILTGFTTTSYQVRF